MKPLVGHNTIGKAFAAFLICLFTYNANAQLNESDTARFQLRAGLNGIRQTGNVDLGILRSRLELMVKISPSFTFKSQNNSLYQEFSGFKADNDINSRNYLYYKPQNRLYPFAMAFVQTNFRLKIDSRFFTGAGLTYQIIRENNHSLKLSGSVVYEETRFSKILFNESYYNDKNLIAIWRPTLYIAGIHKFSEGKVKFNYSAYWQYGIDQVQNQRLQAEIGLDFKLWKGLSITGQYLFLFEQVVPEKILQKDGILTFGLVYQFAKKNN
ncbi:MAG: DUF481 domain-containing protein [Sediminibacterium sp.]